VPSSELEKVPVQTPDPHDEPSVEWGWHGQLHKGAMIAGWFVAIAMFGMLIGNQVGHTEDIYLVVFGALMIFLQLMVIRRRRNSWRR
jgi:Protein of unknown function (DUF2631)